MSLLTQILGGGIGETLQKLVGTFKLSPAAKLEVDRELSAQAHELALKDREYEAKLIEAQTRELEIASANIRAETQTDDPWVRRARPTFLYVVYIILTWNYILLPILQMTGSQPLQPIVLPAELLTLFGAGYLGYGYLRSKDKEHPR